MSEFPQMDAGTIELRGLRKSFGNLEVIHGVDLVVASGEFVVFVGPSGCGKSTLLRMIAGLEEVTEGDVVIGGVDVTDADPARRGIAMVFQSYALYPHMTVRENLAFGLSLTRTPKAEIARIVDEAADVLGIGPLLERRPAQLSGGQRQRVAIGRAIVRRPLAFLFDEPLSNLDAELRVEMRIELARLHRELGNSVIYVTHDQTEAMTLADRIVVLREGRIEQVGTPRQLYEDPANTFVAGFIGSPRMNFLQATWTNDGARIGKAPPLEIKLTTSPGPGTIITLGVRPENLSLEAGAALEGTVELVEYLGGIRYVYVALSDGAAITIEHRGTEDLRIGERVALSMPPGGAVAFNEDGKRLR